MPQNYGSHSITIDPMSQLRSTGYYDNTMLTTTSNGFDIVNDSGNISIPNVTFSTSATPTSSVYLNAAEILNKNKLQSINE